MDGKTGDVIGNYRNADFTRFLNLPEMENVFGYDLAKILWFTGWREQNPDEKNVWVDDTAPRLMEGLVFHESRSLDDMSVEELKGSVEIVRIWSDDNTLILIPDSSVGLAQDHLKHIHDFFS